MTGSRQRSDGRRRSSTENRIAGRGGAAIRTHRQRVLAFAFALLLGAYLGEFQGQPWLLVVVGVLGLIWFLAALWGHRHPAPDPVWITNLRAENMAQSQQIEVLTRMVGRLLPPASAVGTSVLPPLQSQGVGTVGPAIETDVAQPITAVKRKGDWEIFHSWASAEAGLPGPSVIVGIKNVHMNLVPVTRVEVNDPEGNWTRHVIRGLGPTDVAAIFYPWSFENPRPLGDGRYEVTWFFLRDGSEEELLHAAFEIREGRLIP